MATIKKCMISRYDVSIKNPPYLTIPIDVMEVTEPHKDHLGEKVYKRLRNGCRKLGYTFRFYTTSPDGDYDYEVVVY